MSYADFSLESVGEKLGIVLQPKELFSSLVEASVPQWLIDTLDVADSSR